MGKRFICACMCFTSVQLLLLVPSTPLLFVSLCVFPFHCVIRVQSSTHKEQSGTDSDFKVKTATAEVENREK